MRNTVTSFVTILVFLSITAISAHALESQPGGIQWQSYKDGLSLAASSGKKVYINFHADWCKYCTKMANTTFKSKEVIAFLNEHFVAVQVDTEKEESVARKYKVRGLPASFFLEQDGAQIGNQPGYLDPEQFLNMLKFIMKEGYKK
jgi:thioredoxin-related protein